MKTPGQISAKINILRHQRRNKAGSVVHFAAAIYNYRCSVKPARAFDTSSGPIEYNEVSYRRLVSGERPDVVVTGDITAWHTPAAASELSVDSWDFCGADLTG
jgi:hypothetical protein